MPGIAATPAPSWSHGLLAPTVERLPCKEKVQGSIPWRSTEFSRAEVTNHPSGTARLDFPTGCSSAWSECLLRMQDARGSNPLSPTSRYRLRQKISNRGNGM